MVNPSLSMDELKVYFNDDEWSLMSDYEKCSCLNRLQNYKALQNLGFPASKPDFIDQNNPTTNAKVTVETRSKKKLNQQLNVKKQGNEKNNPVIRRKRKEKISSPVQSTNISTPAKSDVRDIETKTKEEKFSSEKDKSDAKEKPVSEGKLIFSETEKKNAIRSNNLLSMALKLNKLYKIQGINVLKEVNKLWALKKTQNRNEKTVIKSQLEKENTISDIKFEKNYKKKNKRERVKSKKKIHIINKNKKIDNTGNEIKVIEGKNKSKNNENKKIKLKELDSKIYGNEETVLQSEPASLEGKQIDNGRRYPKRNIPIKNYTEDEIMDDDEYIFCDDCQKEWPGDCPEHGPLIHLADRKIAKDKKDPHRAIKTTPLQLEVAESEIFGAGKGVWTKCVIPPRVLFGPYDGMKTSAPDELGYSWRIMKNNRVSHFVSGKCTGSSNWMRYVNSARYEKELNVFAFQYKGEIYYRTFKYVPPKTELKVWYGKEFNIRLGISPESFKNPNKELIKTKTAFCLEFRDCTRDILEYLCGVIFLLTNC